MGVHLLILVLAQLVLAQPGMPLLAGVASVPWFPVLKLPAAWFAVVLIIPIVAFRFIGLYF
jgi:hypothetical protein